MWRKIKKTWYKLKKHYKHHKAEYFVSIVLLTIPLALKWIYISLDEKSIVFQPSDILTYFGVAVGMFGSFVVYREEKAKEKKEREDRLRPDFGVHLELVDPEEEIFKLTILLYSESVLRSVYLYDNYCSDRISDQEAFFITYSGAREKAYQGKPLYNISCDDNILDKDGWPHYIQINCDDTERQMWDCIFRKCSDGEHIYYTPSSFSII